MVCSKSNRGRYASPALAAASYPFVDLPVGDTLRCKLFPADKFHRTYNILINHAETLGLLREMGLFALELCAKIAACFRPFAKVVRQMCAKKGEQRRG